MPQKDLNMTNGAPIWSPVNYFVNVRMVVRLPKRIWAYQKIREKPARGFSLIAFKYSKALNPQAAWSGFPGEE